MQGKQKLKSKLLQLFCYLLLSSSPLLAQHNLRQHQHFYQTQLIEFQEWLDLYHFGKLVEIEQIEVLSNQVVLHLKSAFEQNAVDSLTFAWDALQYDYQRLHQERMEQRLFEAFIFQMDLEPWQAKIHIKSHLPRFFSTTISADHRGTIHVDELAKLSYRSSGVFHIAHQDLKSMYRGGSETLNGKTIGQVRQAISRYLYEYYLDKGTPVLYDAKIDTSRTYANELTYKITNISHEILDAGFFEYIKINIEVLERNRQIEIKWNLQGKYGSGIFFAPRESQYKNMEVRYANQLQDYENNLMKQINYYLRQQP